MASRLIRILGSVGMTGLLAAGVSACSVTSRNPEVHLMPLDQLPPEMQAAHPDVRTAYQFAAANPQVSMNVPCYCGCVGIGHTSNFRCYVSRVEPTGAFTFDPHALGCATCVDITQDSMRLLKAGKSIPEIKAYVDATYSRYGAPTVP